MPRSEGVVERSVSLERCVYEKEGDIIANGERRCSKASVFNWATLLPQRHLACLEALLVVTARDEKGHYCNLVGRG